MVCGGHYEGCRHAAVHSLSLFMRRSGGKRLLANLCFYDQMLLSIRLEADLYPPGQKDWSNYSLDVEAATKRFHEDLLRKVLGEPGSSGTIHSSQRPLSQATLDRPCSWRFPWERWARFMMRKAAPLSS